MRKKASCTGGSVTKKLVFHTAGQKTERPATKTYLAPKSDVFPFLSQAGRVSQNMRSDMETETERLRNTLNCGSANFKSKGNNVSWKEVQKPRPHLKEGWSHHGRQLWHGTLQWLEQHATSRFWPAVDGLELWRDTSAIHAQKLTESQVRDETGEHEYGQVKNKAGRHRQLKGTGSTVT